MSDLSAHIKQLEKMVDALKKADKAPLSEGDALSMLATALSSFDRFEVSQVRQAILARQTSVQEALEREVASRRHDLEQAARVAGLSVRRFSDYDKIDAFGVHYKGRKVKLKIGNEELIDFEETSGSKLFQRIVAERDQLNRMLLPREKFFGVMKTALAMARAEGKVVDGKVKIRELFPYIASARQLASESFRKRPSAKSFVDYTLAMIAFELSKFGDNEQGWACSGERLYNQGPSMANQHEAVVLPDASGNPVQVLWVWIA